VNARVMERTFLVDVPETKHLSTARSNASWRRWYYLKNRLLNLRCQALGILSSGTCPSTVRSPRAWTPFR
jgi:hypothetical protein